jgi:hypothetical protein
VCQVIHKIDAAGYEVKIMIRNSNLSAESNSMSVCEPILYTESDKYKEMLNKELYKGLRINPVSVKYEK